MGWAELLQRLKQATGLSDKQVAGMEKRRAFRVNRRVGVQSVRTNGEKVPLLAINMGAQGMRVESPVRLRKGEILAVFKNVLNKDDGHRGFIDVDDDAPRVRVVWSRKHKEQVNYEAGLAFIIDTAPQRRAAAHFLLDDCKVGIGNPREHRKMPRVSAEMNGLLLTEECLAVDIKVKDLAVGGALVLANRGLERNTNIDVKIFLPDVAAPLVCKGTVVRNTRLNARTFELGIAFTKVADDHRDRLVTCLSRLLLRGVPAEPST